MPVVLNGGRIPPGPESEPVEGTGTGSGAGTTGGAANVASNVGLIPSSGGLVGFSGKIAVRFFVGVRKTFKAIFDPPDFDCEESAEYRFKVEDVKEGFKPTINRVRILYRNLGRAKFTVTVKSVKQVHSETLEVGDSSADKKIYTVLSSPVITDEMPQLIITRLANSGPLSIVSATLCGVFGDGAQL